MRRWIVFGLPVLLAGAALAWWLGASPPAAKHATAPVTTGKLEQTVLARLGAAQQKKKGPQLRLMTG